MAVASLENVRKTYGERDVLLDASLSIEEGERVGVVGANGAGKSSLARILAGLEEPDAGRVTRKRESRVLYLAQEPDLPPGVAARDVVLEGLGAWREARQRYEEITSAIEAGDGDPHALAARQAEAGSLLERLGGWDRLHEAEAVLTNVGIDDPTALVDRMSGGQRRRVALARLLVAEPTLAILDEPTNHLDIATIEWLEEFLVRRFRGAVLLVTHDREVLDRVVSRTLEVERGRVTSFDGGYEAFLAGKAEREAYAERVENNRRNYVRSELEWLRRSPKARTGKQKARIGRAEAAIAAPPPPRKQSARLLAEVSRSGKTVLDFYEVAIAREGRTLVERLDMHLVAGDRVGIVGPNGSGKTTLLHTVLGRLEPAAGRIVLGANTRIAYLDQARSGLDDNASIFENVAGDRGHIVIGERSMEPAVYLEQFLFDRPAQRRLVGGLSGGERARVALARLLAEPANLLLLDEPTNDLDVDTLAALESLLDDYAGSVMLVTHDRWMLDRIATRTLVLEPGGKAGLYAGGYADALSQRKAAEDEQRRREEAAPGRGGTTAAGGGEKRRPRRSGLTYGERLELEGLMEKVEEAEARVTAVEARLADPALYEKGGDIAAVTDELARAREEADRLLARWEELETRKAEAEAAS
jgi:ATP-binding cassette subfamily F protein uup